MIYITNEKKHRRKTDTEEESLEKVISFTYAVLLGSLKMHFVLEAKNTFLKNLKLHHDPDYEKAFPWPY